LQGQSYNIFGITSVKAYNEAQMVNLDKLLSNSRFWILVGGITISIIVAGAIQLYVPGGTVQTIRIEEYFGGISLVLLYLAVLASPLTKVFPDLLFKAQYLYARRAIGVLTFYYAAVHIYITFFKQLNGFSGIKYLDTKYSTSLIFGLIAFAILFLLAATSLDYAVRKMHFKNWKLLHRLVYLAVVAVMLHVIIIGLHFVHLGLLSVIVYVALGFLVVLEAVRIQKNMGRHESTSSSTFRKATK
jgi:sulfoxide reductase heme-binding subunit YedZ